MQGGTVENFGGLVALLSRFPGQPRADGARHFFIGQARNACNSKTSGVAACRTRDKMY